MNFNFNQENSVYEEYFKVRAYEVNTFNEANILSIANYLQEAAGQNVVHMNISVQDLLNQGLTWVLMRQKTSIVRFPKVEEIIKVVTYPSGFEKYYVNRDFQVFDAEENLIAYAGSTWLVIDIEKRKMVSVPDFIRSKTVPNDRELFPYVRDKMPKMQNPEIKPQLTVNWHDLDVNDHVNNAKYMQWVVDSFSGDFLKNYQLTELDILYRQESRLGDEIESRSEKVEETYFNHQLLNAQQRKELAQATSKWKPRKNQ